MTLQMIELWSVRQRDCRAASSTTKARDDYGNGNEEFPRVQEAIDGRIIVNIGQLSHAEELAFKRAVGRGELLRWRGKWYPDAGASYGMGPDKTCWSSWNPYAGEGAVNR